MYCNACGKELSDNAEACPSCGEPTKKKKRSIGRGTLIASYVLAAVLPVIGWIMGIYLLVKGRVGQALGVGATGIIFALVWVSVFGSSPSFSWECTATGASSLQCEIRNEGSAAGSLSFDVVAICGDKKHTASVNSGDVSAGGVIQRVVTLQPEIGLYDECAGFEYRNEKVE